MYRLSSRSELSVKPPNQPDPRYSLLDGRNEAVIAGRQMLFRKPPMPCLSMYPYQQHSLSISAFIDIDAGIGSRWAVFALYQINPIVMSNLLRGRWVWSLRLQQQRRLQKATHRARTSNLDLPEFIPILNRLQAHLNHSDTIREV